MDSAHHGYPRGCLGTDPYPYPRGSDTRVHGYGSVAGRAGQRGSARVGAGVRCARGALRVERLGSAPETCGALPQRVGGLYTPSVGLYRPDLMHRPAFWRVFAHRGGSAGTDLSTRTRTRAGTGTKPARVTRTRGGH